jgi:hypothetical protein
MNKQNFEDREEELLKKIKARKKAKKPKMKISGVGVKSLAEIIKRKQKKSSAK